MYGAVEVVHWVTTSPASRVTCTVHVHPGEWWTTGNVLDTSSGMMTRNSVTGDRHLPVEVCIYYTHPKPWGVIGRTLPTEIIRRS